MCNPISWIESEGNVYIITDAKVKSDKGKELIKEAGNPSGIWGHGFCRAYYGLKGGRENEANDFSKLGLFPTEIQKLLKDFNRNFGYMMGLHVPNLRALTTLPGGVKFPEKISGGLDLRALTTLPGGVKFPEKCGWLDLRALTTLPGGVKFPEKISGGLDLSALTTLPGGVKFPEKISGGLDLRALTTLPGGVKFPEECGGLDLRALTTLPGGVKFPEECGGLDLSALTTKDRDMIRKKFGY